MFINDNHQLGIGQVRTPNQSPFYEILLRENKSSETTVIGYAFTEEIASLFSQSYNMYRLLKLLFAFTEGNNEMSDISKILYRLIVKIEGGEQETHS